MAGLLPILHLVYADPRTEATNYLRYTVDLQAHQFGLTPETFRAPWPRITWLALGREVAVGGYLRTPWYPARNAVDLLGRTFIFEVGPLAAARPALAARAPALPNPALEPPALLTHHCAA